MNAQFAWKNSAQEARYSNFLHLFFVLFVYLSLHLSFWEISVHISVKIFCDRCVVCPVPTISMLIALMNGWGSISNAPVVGAQFFLISIFLPLRVVALHNELLESQMCISEQMFLSRFLLERAYKFLAMWGHRLVKTISCDSKRYLEPWEWKMYHIKEAKTDPRE